MKRLLSTIFISFLTALASAQRLDELYTTPSPEAASLGIVDNVPVDLYTGRASISIPLFDLECGNFSMPISLSYNSEGFKPNLQSGWVGQNWSLQAGGVITRVVKGQPDENPGYGMYYSYDKFIERDDEAFYLTAEREGKVDTELDEFHFSVNGLSGVFYLNQDKEFISTTPGIKIEYTKKLESIGTPVGIKFTNLTFPGFIITDAIGNRYYFGNFLGKKNLVDLSFCTSSVGGIPEYSTATSWLLSHVVPANGQSTIYFDYSEQKLDITTSYLEKKPQITFEGDGQWSCDISIPRSSTLMNYISHSYVKSIRCDTWKLDFYTSQIEYQDHPAKEHLELYGLKGGWQKLDSIVMKITALSERAKVFRFNYRYPVRKRLFLEALEEVGKPAHKFEYYAIEKAEDIPFDTRNIDHWGFHTRDANHLNPSSFRMIPSHLPFGFFSQFGTMYYPSREADFEHSVMGMLKTIHYPTGAMSEFIYELSTYSNYMYYDAEDSSLYPVEITQRWNRSQRKSFFTNPNDTLGTVSFEYPSLVQLNIVAPYISSLPTIDSVFLLKKGTYKLYDFINKSWPRDTWYSITFYYQEIIPSSFGYGGGIRIKEIRQRENSKNICKEYKYQRNFIDNPSDTASSGYLSHYPSYGCNYLLNSSGRLEAVGVMKASSTNSFDYTNGRQIGYSSVVEIIKSITDGVLDTLGYIEYRYTNFDNNFYWDEMPLPMSILMASTDYYARTKKEFCRGKVLEKNTYDKNKNIKQSITCEYDVFEHVPKEWSSVALFSKKADISPCFEGGAISYNISEYKILNQSFLPVKKTTTDYVNGQGISTTTIYAYNDHDLLKEQTICAEDTIKTTYTYPADYTAAPYPDMVERNMLSYVVEKKTYENGRFAGASKTDYGYIDGFYKPARDLYSKALPTYQEERTYELYDMFGNVVQYADKDGIRTVLLWGHNSQCPIFVIRDVTYDELDQVFGVFFFNPIYENALYTDETIRELDEELRAKLPGKQITTYTYKPLVGVTSVKAPNGQTTHYSYDAFGRLQESYLLINGAKKTIEAYDYHYSNQ